MKLLIRAVMVLAVLWLAMLFTGQGSQQPGEEALRRK